MTRAATVMFKYVTAILVIVFLSENVYAQGSPYYFLGFGDPVSVTHSRLEALGGTGVALTGGALVNELNPAGYAYLPNTLIDVRLRFSYTESTLGSDQGSGHFVKLGGIAVGAPIWTAARMGLALGFNPVTDAEGQTQRTDSLGSTVYRREGGLSQFYLGVSARPISPLAIGGRFDILFGNVRTVAQATVSGDEVQASIFQREYSESGVRGTFGFLLSLDSLFPELRGLTIGAAYSTSSSLTSTERTVVTPISSSLDSTIETPGYGVYPSEIRIGLAGRFGDRYRAEANITGQDFSNSRVYSATKDFSGDPTLGASNRYSFAFERTALPAEDARGAAFWDKTALRIGASYAQLPFKPAAGVNVTEISASLGLGIPFGNGSMMDLSGVFGTRTPSNTSIAPKDTFFKIGVTVMISEKWFVPLRRGDDDE